MNKQTRQAHQEEMFSFIEQWKESKKDQLSFCREKEVSYTTFHYWLKKYRRLQLDPQGFIPIEISSGNHQLIEVRYPNGVIIQLPSVDLKVLKQLVHL